MIISIPLSKNGKYAGLYEAIVDDCDSDLATLNWNFNTGTSTRYVKRQSGKERIFLHRVILERILGRPLAKSEICDHVDGNGLNNTRKNLRLATPSQNCSNRKRAKNNTSGYKGVTFHKSAKKWQAVVMYGGASLYLGLFDTKEGAYEAWKVKALEMHGNFVNFGGEDVL